MDFPAWLPEVPLELSEMPVSEVSDLRQKEDESGFGPRTKKMVELTLEEPATPKRRTSFTLVC